MATPNKRKKLGRPANPDKKRFKESDQSASSSTPSSSSASSSLATESYRELLDDILVKCETKSDHYFEEQVIKVLPNDSMKLFKMKQELLDLKEYSKLKLAKDETFYKICSSLEDISPLFTLSYCMSFREEIKRIIYEREENDYMLNELFSFLGDYVNFSVTYRHRKRENVIEKLIIEKVFEQGRWKQNDIIVLTDTEDEDGEEETKEHHSTKGNYLLIVFLITHFICRAIGVEKVLTDTEDEGGEKETKEHHSTEENNSTKGN